MLNLSVEDLQNRGYFMSSRWDSGGGGGFNQQELLASLWSIQSKITGTDMRQMDLVFQGTDEWIPQR